MIGWRVREGESWFYDVIETEDHMLPLPELDAKHGQLILEF